MKNASRMLFVVATLAFTSCSTTTCPFPMAKSGKVEHIVLAWLKNPGNAADRDRRRRRSGGLWRS